MKNDIWFILSVCTFVLFVIDNDVDKAVSSHVAEGRLKL